MEETIDSKYKIKTGTFEGPLEVLLGLIEQRRLFINEISLAQVTEDFLAYLKSLEGSNLEEIANFISVAATLILIKSKSLLPGIKLEEDEDKQIGDLEKRLAMFKIIQGASEDIKRIFGKKFIFFQQEKRVVSVFYPTPEITLDNLMNSARSVISAIPKEELLPKIEVKKVVSIEEMINSLTERIQKSMNMNFSDLWGGGKVLTKKEKVFVVVGFLAMLELVRQGIIDVMQSTEFEEIKIEKQAMEQI